MTVALVLGGAANVFDDVDKALALAEFDGVLTINDITADWRGPVDAAVSLHGEKWSIWLTRREKAGLPPPKRVFAHQNLKKSAVRCPNSLITDFVDHLWPGQKDSGSSGLFAVKIALDHLHYDKVVLCGVPMSAEHNHYFNPKPWGGAASHRRGWAQTWRFTKDRVKSMSGWTQQQLGKPSVSWLKEADDGEEFRACIANAG